jgi:hypothetical protein
LTDDTGIEQRKQPEPADEAMIALLVARDGPEITVKLADSRVRRVLNIAWGYDMGDEYAHLTTNCSPFSNDHPIDFFFTDEVEEIADGRNGDVPWPSIDQLHG